MNIFGFSLLLVLCFQKSESLTETPENFDPVTTFHPKLLAITCAVRGTTAEFSGSGELTQTTVRAHGTWKKWEEAIINEGITSLGGSCFLQCYRLCRISLPSTLTMLGQSCLQQTCLVTIEIPKAVTSIGWLFVNGVESLTAITVELGNSVYSSDGISLYQGTLLIHIPVACTLVPIREDTTEIYADAGRWSRSDTIVLPDKVTTVNSYAFCGCWMRKLVIGKSVSNINTNAFDGCANITEIEVVSGNTVYTCVNGVFQSSTCILRVYKGTSINIGREITSVSGSSLCLCKDLVTVTVDSGNTVLSAPSSSQYILKGTTLLSGVGGCREVTIGGDVTVISDSAFWYNSKLEKVIFEEGTSSLTLKWTAFAGIGSLKSVECRRTKLVFESGSFSGSDLSEFTILPSCVTTLKPAFSGSNIKTLSLPEVTTIVSGAFSRCRVLEEISMPKIVTINSFAFEWCVSLRKIDFGSGRTLKTIGDLAFTMCQSLQSITIPGSVTSLASSMFGETPNLTSIIVTEPSNYISANSLLYTSDRSTLVICPAGCSRVTLLPGTTSIAKLAFYSCNSLTEVTMNDGLERIELNAFYECEILPMIRIPSSVSYIGENAVTMCPSLTSIFVCATTDCSSFTGSPFPTECSVYVFFGYHGETFCNHEVVKILDAECNMPTSFFTELISTCNRNLGHALVYQITYPVLYCI